MVATCRAAPAGQLQCIDTSALRTLDGQAFMYKAQGELLAMKEKKALHALWKRPSDPRHEVRTAAEGKLRAATLQVIKWREDMEAYEAAASDFMATLNCQSPSRSLQANIVFQGRTRYLGLVTALADAFKAVRNNYADALKSRKSRMKSRRMETCGVHAEFFAHPNAIALGHKEVLEDLRCREEERVDEPTPIYSRRQLKDVLDLFDKFPVLTHGQIMKLVPVNEDLVGSYDLVREQLLRELPVLAIRLQYRDQRPSANAHTQYIYGPALNGCAFAHVIHLLSAAEQDFNAKRLLKDPRSSCFVPFYLFDIISGHGLQSPRHSQTN